MKYFNGECYDFAKESVSCIVSLSLTLKDAQNFEDFETAVKSVEQESINVSYIDCLQLYMNFLLVVLL